MISAIDSSVVLDVITGDRRFADASEAALRRARAEGRLIVCECVVAELRPAFDDSETFEEFLRDWQLEFVASSRESAALAGAHFSVYLARGGKAGRVVADFLIGTHAQLHADRLVARDRGYLRGCFSGLTVMDPASPAA